MFHNIPDAVRERMQYLEEIDNRDRVDGTPREQRLRQIPSDTGRFLSLLAASAPDGIYLEIGTSAGYSTLWLALAALERNTKIITFEINGNKAVLARETFTRAGIEDIVRLVVGDAREHLKDYDDIAFCFLDAEKEDYIELYEQVVPRLKPGGFLVADNVISHADTLAKMVTRAETDRRVDAVVVPIGKGELFCRKL